MRATKLQNLAPSSGSGSFVVRPCAESQPCTPNKNIKYRKRILMNIWKISKIGEWLASTHLLFVFVLAKAHSPVLTRRCNSYQARLHRLPLPDH